MPPRSRRLEALRSGLIAALVWLCVAAAWPSVSCGQPPQAGGWKALEGNEKTGEVVEVGPGRLQLRLPKGAAAIWQAIPAPAATIEVTGKASRDLLQPKQFINCAVTLDDTGRVTEPALQVTFPDGGAAGVIAGGLGIGEEGKRRLPGKRPAGSYLIAGTIKQVDGDVVTVMAGRERFEITVPAEAELVVRSQNVGLAAAGDAVEVEGKYQQKGQVVLTSLKITLSNPVVPPPPKNKVRKPAG